MRFAVTASASLLALCLAVAAHASAIDSAQKAQRAFKDGQFDKAADLYTAALTSEDVPADFVSELYHQRGLSFQRAGKQRRAVADFTKALWTGGLPNRLVPVVYLARALSYDALKERELAMLDVTQALQIKSDYAEAYAARGVMRAETNDEAGAIADFSSAVKNRHPEPYIPLFRLGQIFEARNQVADAADYYRQALLAKPDYAPALERMRAPKFAPYAGPMPVASLPPVSAETPSKPETVAAASPVTTPVPILPPPAQTPPAPAPAPEQTPAPVTPPAAQPMPPEATPVPPPAASTPPASPPAAVAEPVPAPVETPKPAVPAPATPVTSPPAAPVATPVPATPAPTTAPAPVAATGSTKLQLGAYSGRAQAEKGWSDLQAKHGALLASLTPLIEEAQSNGKTVFRLRLGPMGDADAKKLCADLKARGTACFIARN